MIVVDVETGGLDPIKNPLLSIGAVDFTNFETFYVEITPAEGLEINKQALEVNGIDPKNWLKTDLEFAMQGFSLWLLPRPDTVLAGHNPSFDLGFLNQNFMRAGLKNPFGFRTVDLHTLAYAKFGKSLKSDDIYVALGMPPEPRPHVGLNGAKWEAEAFYRLLYPELQYTHEF